MAANIFVPQRIENLPMSLETQGYGMAHFEAFLQRFDVLLESLPMIARVSQMAKSLVAMNELPGGTVPDYVNTFKLRRQLQIFIRLVSTHVDSASIGNIQDSMKDRLKEVDDIYHTSVSSMLTGIPGSTPHAMTIQHADAYERILHRREMETVRVYEYTAALMAHNIFSGYKHPKGRYVDRTARKHAHIGVDDACRSVFDSEHDKLLRSRESIFECKWDPIPEEAGDDARTTSGLFSVRNLMRQLRLFGASTSTASDENPECGKEPDTLVEDPPLSDAMRFVNATRVSLKCATVTK